MANQREITICTYFKITSEPVHEIDEFSGDNTLRGFLRAFKAAIQAKEYDVIHAHVPHTGVLLLLATLAFGLFSRVMPISVYTVQNSYQNYKPRNRLMMLPIFFFFKEVVFCSNACLASFPAFYRWLCRGKAHVVQNAVDLERIDRTLARTEKDPLDSQFRVVSIGRIIKIKNPNVLLKAFNQVNDQNSQLVYVGEGDLRPQLTQAAEELGLKEQVELTGLVGRDEVFKHAAEADLFVSTSLGEGLPVAVEEAMACYCPVILSDIPPHREIAEGVDIIPLIHPNDVEGFAREIQRFREMSIAERREIGNKCREVIEKRFSLSIMHANLEVVYKRLPPRQGVKSTMEKAVSR